MIADKFHRHSYEKTKNFNKKIIVDVITTETDSKSFKQAFESVAKVKDGLDKPKLQSESAFKEMRLEDENNPGTFNTRYVYVKNGDLCVTIFRETAV